MNNKNAELIFSDDRINAIDDTVSKGIAVDIIHRYADDSPPDGRTVKIKDKCLINFISCSYFGLEIDPRITNAVAEAAIKYGTNCSVSRNSSITPGKHKNAKKLAIA